MSGIVRIPKGQHTVSQVVLRKFTTKSLLTVYDRETQLIRNLGPGGAFKMQFDQYDSLGSEERWGKIEKRLPKAYTALEARTASGDEEIEDLLRDLLAMHWARSAAMRMAHEIVTRNVRDDHIVQMSESPELLRFAYRQRTGMELVGQEGLDWYNQTLHERVVGENSEMWWSQRNKIHYEQARERFAESSIQIGYSSGDDLLIGDAPVITMKSNHEGVGPHQGVALGDANLIAMPVAPNTVVGLGPVRLEVDLPPRQIFQYNVWQVRGFINWLGCQPGGATDRRMRADLPAKKVLPPRV
jgi:hypothetical protein